MALVAASDVMTVSEKEKKRGDGVFLMLCHVRAQFVLVSHLRKGERKKTGMHSLLLTLKVGAILALRQCGLGGGGRGKRGETDHFSDGIRMLARENHYTILFLPTIEERQAWIVVHQRTWIQFVNGARKGNKKKEKGRKEGPIPNWIQTMC